MSNPNFHAGPRHRQVATILRNRIRSGDLPPQAQLPTELELTESYNVSRTVVRQAMQALEFEGLIRRIAGKGTFVLAAPQPKAEWAIGSLEDLKVYGTSTSLKILSHKEVRATDEVASALHIARGAPVVEIRGLRTSAAGPLAYQRNYLLLDVGRSVKQVNLARVPMIDAMERELDIHILRATQWFAAVAAEGEECRLLKVKPGAPLLQIQRLFQSQERGPVEFATTHFRPDRYKHVSTITRT